MKKLLLAAIAVPLSDLVVEPSPLDSLLFAISKTYH